MTAEPASPRSIWSRRRVLSVLGAAAAASAGAGLIRTRSSSGSTDLIEEATQAAPSGPSRLTEDVLGAKPELELLEGPEGSILTPVMAESGEPPPDDHLFDLVVIGGRVVDPASGFDGLVNVGIDGSTITALRPGPVRGRETIRANGLIVAPGFIDLLSYEPNSFGSWLKLADGVTSNLAMHGVGRSAPAFFSRYHDASPMHFGGAFHHHHARGLELKIGIEDRISTATMRRLETMAATGMEQGFAGIAFAPEYSPGTSNGEMDRLVALAAQFGHVSFFHLRHSDPDPPGTSLEALAEVLSIAERHRAAVHIQHLTSTGGTFVMDETIGLIENARRIGIDVTACVYPYNFWGTFLASSRFDEGWQDRYRIDYNDLQIAGTDERLTAATFARARGENKLVAALGSIPEQEVQLALSQPWVMIGSDAIPTVGLNNHPRGAGTFARLLGRYVRDLGLLDLRTGLAKLTIQPALRVEAMIPAMKRKGRLQRGADADITIFDPAVVTDRATVAQPGLVSEGIEWVLVNGRIALRAGQVQSEVLAGQALRSVVR